MTISTIVFDWGGVLIEHPILPLCRLVAPALGKPPEECARAFHQYERRFQLGREDEGGLLEEISREAGMARALTLDEWVDAFRQVYREQPEVFGWLPRLRERGYTVALLSNSERPSTRIFYEHAYPWFDAVVYSCEVGAVKPEPRIYDIALERLGVPAGEAVFLDDRPENIEGARAVGMEGIVFRTPAQAEAELRALGVDW